MSVWMDVGKQGLSVNEKKHWWNLQMRKSSWSVIESGWIICGNSDILQEFAFKKQLHMMLKYVDGSVGAMVRMMVRGGCLPVRGNIRMSWKYDNEHGVCGEVE